MATMIDYLQWRGDLTFTQDPPNCVDALIFSTLSYIRYGGVVESDRIFRSHCGMRRNISFVWKMWKNESAWRRIWIFCSRPRSVHDSARQEL